MQEESPLFSLSLDPATKSQLSGAAYWARLFAIAGIVSLLIIGASAVLSSSGSFYFGETGRSRTSSAFVMGTILGTFLLIIIPLFAFIFLLQFSNSVKKSLEADDQNQLNFSFQKLKIYFRYLGILTLIFVALMLLSFVLKLAGTAN